MNKEIFDKLIGMKISILVDNLTPSGKRESYVGEIKESGKNYICLILDQNSWNPPISAIYIKHDIILSIWVYK